MEAQLRLTKDDVGKRFRRADGGIAEIVGWDSLTCTEWKVYVQHKAGGCIWHSTNGQANIGEEQYNLVERITEEPVNEFDWDKFNEAISKSSNICSGAKQAIERAIAAWRGEEWVKPLVGQVWRGYDIYDGLWLAAQTSDKKFFIKITNGTGWLSYSTLQACVCAANLKYAAPSLKDYVAQHGGTL